MRTQPEWSDLRTFLDVAREGSFSGAASLLGVHHTTVARRMEQLEQALTVQLFDRHARGARLTLAGEALREHTRAIEERVLQASLAVAGRDHRLEGRVRLTAPPELLPALMPILRSFREIAPRVQVQLDGDAAIRDLGRREADLALRAGSDPPDDAIAHPIARVVWNTYRHPQAPSDRWVLYAPDIAPAVVQRELIDGAEPALIVHSVWDASLAIRAGIGAGVLPDFAVAPELVPMGDPVSHGQLWLLVHVDLRRVARVRALADHLRTTLAAQVQRSAAGSRSRD